MPFGSSMDAWASYYDYDYSKDSIEVEDGIASARASSELGHSGVPQRNAHFADIQLESLPPSSIPNSAMALGDRLRSANFAINRHIMAPVEDSDPTSTQPDSRQFDLSIDYPQSPRYNESKPSVHVNFGDNAASSTPHREETFSYNTTPPLALIERQMARTWIGLTWGEIKLLALAGAGFLMDAYNLFIINMIYPILLRAYWPSGTSNIDWGLSGGVLKASASMGNVIGQLLFGFLGDFWGRSVLYGKELMLAMFAIILMIAAPDSVHGTGVTIWIIVFRFIMGLGIGADCPLSASVVADRSSLKTRGLLLSLIFSNQGWGGLMAALAVLTVVGGYKPSIESGDFSKLSGAWRILAGLPLAPGLIVLYFRLTLVESARFVQARYLQDHDDLQTHASAAGLTVIENSRGQQMTIDSTSAYTSTELIKNVNNRRKTSLTRSSVSSPLSSKDESRYKSFMEPAIRRPSRAQLPSPKIMREALRKTAAQSKGFDFKSIGVPRNDFWEYFSEWRHSKVLIGTSLSWFLVDITFYGINLNQSGIFSLIGYTQGDAWHHIYKQALGNLIVVLTGFLPGYYLTVAFVEVIGRKKIQMFGFAVNAILFLVLALTYNKILHQAGPFFSLFVLLQLSFNFGSNSTTFIVPAEAFPTRIRATAHGSCAAMGKLGSIISSLGFSVLANDERFGHTGIFWIFCGVSCLGLLVTVLLVPETKGYDADAVDRQELLERARMA